MAGLEEGGERVVSRSGQQRKDHHHQQTEALKCKYVSDTDTICASKKYVEILRDVPDNKFNKVKQKLYKSLPSIALFIVL